MQSNAHLDHPAALLQQAALYRAALLLLFRFLLRVTHRQSSGVHTYREIGDIRCASRSTSTPE